MTLSDARGQKQWRWNIAFLGYTLAKKIFKVHDANDTLIANVAIYMWYIFEHVRNKNTSTWKMHQLEHCSDDRRCDAALSTRVMLLRTDEWNEGHMTAFPPLLVSKLKVYNLPCHNKGWLQKVSYSLLWCVHESSARNLFYGLLCWRTIVSTTLEYTFDEDLH